MAKIIQKGKDLDWQREEKCSACNTEFVIGKDDVEVGSFLSGSYYTSCPACGKYIPYSHLYGTHHRIPDHVKAYANNKYTALLLKKIAFVIMFVVIIVIVLIAIIYLNVLQN